MQRRLPHGQSHTRPGDEIDRPSGAAPRALVAPTGQGRQAQVQDGVTHVIADTFWLPKLEASPPSGGNHDFH